MAVEAAIHESKGVPVLVLVFEDVTVAKASINRGGTCWEASRTRSMFDAEPILSQRNRKLCQKVDGNLPFDFAVLVLASTISSNKVRPRLFFLT